MYTPWGESDGSKSYGEGITFYSTPSHGGLRVDAELVKKMPAPFVSGDDYFAKQRAAGWFEEDCDYAFVVLAFSGNFNAEEIEHASQKIRDCYPDQYEAAYGCTIPAEDSRKKRERVFREAHMHDYVTVSAIQSSTDPSMVEVSAVVGGRNESGHYDQSAIRKFLVPRDEYRTGDYSVGFVIDTKRHREMPQPDESDYEEGDE